MSLSCAYGSSKAELPVDVSRFVPEDNPKQQKHSEEPWAKKPGTHSLGDLFFQRYDRLGNGA